jgi:hypothetical protein
MVNYIVENLQRALDSYLNNYFAPSEGDCEDAVQECYEDIKEILAKDFDLEGKVPLESVLKDLTEAEQLFIVHSIKKINELTGE